jgi:hypothetical protein
MSGHVTLWCGSAVLEVDASIAEMSLPRVQVAAFSVPSPSLALPLLRVERVPGLVGQPVEGPLGRCTVQLAGEVLRVDLAEGPFLGELALRLAYYLGTARQGGLLVHSSALASGDVGLLACGKSGAGKSTLARLGRASGLRLLTDEVVQVFPDGRICGTPFRSDPDNVGSPGSVRARYFVALEKASAEALVPLPPLEAAGLLMAQRFEVEELSLSRAEVQRRALAFLSAVELRTLRFRKHAEAGRFVADALA